MSKGFVYILSNPSILDGLLKIGMTSGNVEVRAKALQTTGVPAQFKIEYRAEVPDCGLVELVVHRRLASDRYAPNREFFSVSLDRAISVLDDVADASKNPEALRDLEKEWRVQRTEVGQTDRYAAFEHRVDRCPPAICEALQELRTEVSSWQDVSTDVDSKCDGLTFYRELDESKRRRFFRIDPKHSANPPNIGVAFFGLTPDRIRSSSGFSVREELVQPGDWIFIHDAAANSDLLRLARESYDSKDSLAAI